MKRRAAAKDAAKDEVETPVEKKPTTNRFDVVQVIHDPINEQVVIAAALVDAGTRRTLVRRFTTDFFHESKHTKIWAVIKTLDERSLEYDPATVDQLSGGKVDVQYMEELLSNRPVVPANLQHHCEALEWDKLRMDAIKGPVGSFLEAIRDPTEDRNQVRAKAVSVAKAFDAVESGLIRDPSALCEEQITAVRSRLGGVGCYSYGVEGLDCFDDGSRRMMPGAAPGEMTVVTALSGSGKTTLVANIVASEVAQKKKILFGAWEQGAGTMLEMIACIRAKLSLSKARAGLLLAEDVDLLHASMRDVSRHVRFLELPRPRGIKYPSEYNERVLSILERELIETKCDWFIADLFRRAFKGLDPDQEESCLISMQGILQRTKVHGFLTHQQRLKDVEQRAVKIPTREGLKGSGAWVEVSDTILAPHRPSLWNNKIPDDVMQVMILKQRYGKWPLAVEFEFDGEKGRIWNGHEIRYDSSGETDVDEFLSGSMDNKPARRGKR